MGLQAGPRQRQLLILGSDFKEDLTEPADSQVGVCESCSSADRGKQRRIPERAVKG